MACGTVTFTDALTIHGLSEAFVKLRDSLIAWDEVLIDMSTLSRIDVAAVQMLIAARKEGESSGKKLVLRLSDTITGFIASSGIQL